MAKRVSMGAELLEAAASSKRSFSRVTAFVVALENYRKPSSGDALPLVDFAHADGDALANAARKIYAASLIIWPSIRSKIQRSGFKRSLRRSMCWSIIS